MLRIKFSWKILPIGFGDMGWFSLCSRGVELRAVQLRGVFRGLMGVEMCSGVYSVEDQV
mgnify:CR=1 FL=1